MFISPGRIEDICVTMVLPPLGQPNFVGKLLLDWSNNEATGERIRADTLIINQILGELINDI